MTGCTVSAPDLADLVRREVGELHEVFQTWLGGAPPAGAPMLEPDLDERAHFERAHFERAHFERTLFERIGRALADDFTMVTPAGLRVGRGPLLARLRAERGSRPGLEIVTAEVRLLQQRGSLLLAGYQEWQRSPGEAARGRLSSALFGRDDARPNGLVWLHVHETWLPGEVPPPGPARRERTGRDEG